jgi:hypothetical protein
MPSLIWAGSVDLPANDRCEEASSHERRKGLAGRAPVSTAEIPKAAFDTTGGKYEYFL